MEIENRSIEVRLKGFGILKKFIKEGRVNLKRESQLIDLIHIIGKQYGQEFRKAVIDPQTSEISSAVCIMVNGKIANDLKERVKNGDEITLFIPVSGG